MKDTIFGIPNMDMYLVVGILLFFVSLEVISGYLSTTKRTSSDWIQELGTFVVLGFIIKPLIILTVLFLGQQFLPDFQYLLNGRNFWLLLFLFLLLEDFAQYWYHRSAHEYDFLWKLHRPHHQAEEMGFFVSYRNAALYYILMPNIWWIGFFTFLGGAMAVAVGLILKQVIIISSHSTLHYDQLLYRYKFLDPVATLVERIFITPAFHHAHHGKSKLDGISDPNGNYGNMFSIWDQMFGTAFFSRKVPLDFGLPNDPKEHWTAASFFPVVTAKNPESEISKGYRKTKTTRREPSSVELVKGQKYLYCQCGYSKTQPFCDASHHGTKYKPLLFEAKKTGMARLCNCKLTKSGPFCDDSHLET